MPHTICTHSVELTFHEQKENLFLQEKIAAVVKDRLAPALENLFDEKASPRKYIKIETLDIDLGRLNSKNWEDEFVQQSIRKIRTKLDEIVSFASDDEVYEVKYVGDEVKIEKVKSTETEIDILVYFIRRGILPWNAQITDIHELLESVLTTAKERSAEVLRKILLEGILYSANSLERFILQFSKNEVRNFLRVLLPAFEQYKEPGQALSVIDIVQPKKYQLSFLIQLLLVHDEVITAAVKRISKEIVFTQKETDQVIPELPKILMELSDKPWAGTATAEIIKEARQITKDLFHDVAEEKIPKQKLKEPKKGEEEDFYFIENAGLVILHPFLHPLFDLLEYLEEKRFLNDAIHRKAVLLSQFLVTGETEIPEYHLLLNKLLCGYPFNEPVDAFLELNETEEKEANELLESVLKHWTALKTTSVAGLRSSFLQREGKLTEKEDFWLLQVEQKSYDVLMNYLPWGIGIIKLPWMEKRLMVEWNS